MESLIRGCSTDAHPGTYKKSEMGATRTESGQLTEDRSKGDRARLAEAPNRTNARNTKGTIAKRTS